MLKPGISAIETGIRLAFLPYPSWEEFDQLHIDVFERMKNNRSNPRLVPNYIKDGPDLIEYDHMPDNGGVFIVNAIAEAYRNADLILATYENQTKYPSSINGRSALCLSDPRTKSIDRQTRFTAPSIEAWCMDQGYQLPPPMDHETLSIFLGHLSQDSDTQLDSAFDRDDLLGRLKEELTNPKPSHRRSESYLTSYIYALTELKSIFGKLDIEGGDILINPQPYELYRSSPSRAAVELSASTIVAASPLAVFHKMEGLSFKEIVFSFNPDSAVVQVIARSKQASVALSDLGLTHKTNKVRLNALGELFMSVVNGNTVTQTNTSALTRLTKSLKNAFHLDDSPFNKRKPVFKWRTPKDDRAKQTAKKSQIRFNDEVHGAKEGNDAAGDAWLNSHDPDYNPNDYAD